MALLAPGAHATSGPDPLLVERVKFLTAERLLARGELARFDALAGELAEYPLHPYLVEARFLRRLSQATAADYERTRDALAHTPLLPELEHHWLHHLAATGRWARFLALYASSKSPDLECEHAHALLALGRPRDAFDDAAPLWLVGRSQDAACDPVFRAWLRHGLPYRLVRARVQLAFERGDASLVRYLRRYLHADDRFLADAWLELRADPRRLLDYADSPRADLDPLLEDAIRRMAYRNPDQAIDLWKRLSAHRTLPIETAARPLARALFRRQEHARAFEWFARLPPESLDQRTRAERIFNAVALAKWTQALAWIEALPARERASERWRYWQARVLAALGRGKEAKALWSVLAKERSYYGYLSADRTGAPYRFHDRPLALDSSAFAPLESSDAYRRARELRGLGRAAAFRREWRYLLHSMKVDPEVAAGLAYEHGWHSVAITSLARAGALDALDIRFPVLYEGLLREHGDRQGLSVAWLLATVRQESAFMTDVRSHAGALGLMQVMPATARLLAARNEIREFSPDRLLEAPMNIHLGTSYLRELLDEFEHPLLASAAYNAGPARVRRWRPKNRPISADLWVETIPFTETRKYVERIAYYQVIYARQLGKGPLRLADLFDDIEPPPS